MTYVNLPLDGTALVTSVNGQTGIVVLDKDDIGLTNVDNTSDATKNAAAVALTNKTIDADLNTISNIDNADIKAAAGISVNKLAAVTADRVLLSNGSGFISASTITNTTLGYLDATSSIQTQLNAKQATGNYVTSLTGEATGSGPGATAVTLTNSAVIGKVLTAYSKGAGTISSSDSILSSIQKLDANDDAKQTRATLTTKGDLYVATASDTVVRQAVGTNGHVLTSDSTQTNGIKYALPVNDSKWVNNLGLASSVGASALTIAVKTSAGADASSNDPIFVNFRNATATTGQHSTVSITGALSVVISSGSTLAQRNSIASYIYIYLINNAGTAELAVSRTLFDDGSIVTTTAEGGAGAADSASTIYSTSARSNVALRMIGRLLNTQTTAGTWASAGTELSILPFENKEICGVMAKTSSQNPGTTAATKITFDSVASSEQAFDPWNLCDLTNERLICSKVGKWQLIISLHLANFEASTTLQVLIYKDGASYLRYDIASLALGTTRNVFIAPIVDVDTVGAYFEIFTSSSADSSYSIVGNTGVDTKSFFGMKFIK